MPDSRTATLLPTATVSRRNGVQGSNIDGEIVLLSAEHRSYFGLNGIGSMIWRRLATPVRIDALCDDMAAQFDGDTAVIASETIDFLRLLRDRELIVVRRAEAD